MRGDTTRLRMGILGVVVISLFSALLARLWYLQVLAAPTYQNEAQLNSVRFIYTEAPRGRILDRNGQVLVGNRVVPTVVVEKEELGDKPDDIIRHLAALVKLPEALLKERIEDPRYSPFKPIPVADDVPKETLIHIREHQEEYPGVHGVMLTKRFYPNASVAAHVLGYVGEINDEELVPRKSKGYRPGDSIGKSGVELAYEDDLRGQPEVEKLEVDAQGRVLRSLGRQPSVQGHDVRLTIDLELQKVAEESLQQSLAAAQATYDNESAKRFLAPAGSAVVLDPRDGSVLAMASFPTYNPSDFVDGISEKTFTALQDPVGHYPLNNRVTQGLYAPASTFKLVTSIAGLETGLITPQYTVNDRGTFTIGDPPTVLTNAFSEAFGYVNLSAALTVSSDVYFYELGSRFCPGRCRTGIQDTAKELGMGDFTEIELPFEASGRIPDEQTKKRLHDSNPDAFPDPEWYTGDNLNLAIGQGDTVITPLQLVNAYATLANGGTVFAPHVGGAVIDVTGVEVRKVEPRVNRKTEMPAAIREPVVAGFEGVVANSRGTAAPAFVGFPLSQFPIAGKTGTAQVSGKQDTALFSAFGPTDDPRYAVTVVMEEAGFGAAAAAPVARRIFDQIAALPLTPITRVVARLAVALDLRRADTHRGGSMFRHVDLLLLAAIAGITAIGLLMIYSSTRQGQAAAGLDPGYFVKRQALFVVVGLAVMIGVALFDYQVLRDIAPAIYAASLFVLLLVLSPLGTERRGTQAWFQVGPYQFEPSEMAKLALVIALSAFCATHRGELDVGRLTTALGIAALPLLLIYLQPDVGTGMVFVAILMGILLVGGASPRQIAILTLLGITAIVMVLQLGVLKDYQRDRLSAFLDPKEDVQRSAYNLNQSKIAIAAGGVGGRGLFQGTQTNLSFVPEQHTDFIFTAVGEELGFVGSSTLLGLFGLVMWRTWRAAITAKDQFGMLVCVGVLAMLVFQVFENVGMTMGITPIAGIPLPLMSYGGSATVACFAALGLVLSVQMRRFS